MGVHRMSKLLIVELETESVTHA